VLLREQYGGQAQGERGVAAQHGQAGPGRERVVAVRRRVGGADLRVLREGLLDGERGGGGEPQQPRRDPGRQDGGDREDVGQHDHREDGGDRGGAAAQGGAGGEGKDGGGGGQGRGPGHQTQLGSGRGRRG